MNETQQTQELARITREDLLREILMNLFEKMGLEPVLTHGPLEQGKDIVCRERNSFGVSEFIGAVVKVGKITGSTSGPASLQTVINQVQEAFVHPYKSVSEKAPIRINKVLVITNAEVSATAREKLIDKLESLGVLSPNVHFLDGSSLVKLLNDHWKEFWKERSDALAPTDPMSKEVGLVLYVLARAFTLSRPQKKKRLEAELSLPEIVKQTGLNHETVESALAYLIKTQYLEKRNPETYTLHHNLTRGRLLTDLRQIRLLLEIEKIANGNLHFTRKEVSRAASKNNLKFKANFVTRTLDFLAKGGYIQVDASRAQGHFILNANMLADERKYLECWLDYRTALPSIPRS
jgi:hypothetical protein